MPAHEIGKNGGFFFAFDGIDGTGKSTQAQLFADWLRGHGLRVVSCRDPGTTPLGERLRELILRDAGVQPVPRCEALLYMAARAQLVQEVIEPTLRSGASVVSDRFLLANVAYQGYGCELGTDDLYRIGQFATAGRLPDCVFLLDLDVPMAMLRRGLDTDRMEARDTSFFERVRQGFLSEARRHPREICLVDAAASVDEVQQVIREAALKRTPRLEGVLS